MNVKLIAIAALGKNREIGLKGKLPWSLPDEHAQYLEKIKEKYVIIGRKNLDFNNGDVEGAYPLVLSRSPHSSTETALFFTSLDHILSYLEEAEVEEAFVIGGGEIYELFLPYITEFYWTEVNYSGEADTYFPDFSAFEWQKLFEEKHSGWTLRKLIKIPKRYGP
jgi:dihydrofolate reductase